MKTDQKNTTLLAAAIKVLADEPPCTLPRRFYLFVSAGELPNVRTACQRLGKLLSHAREFGLVDLCHNVDHLGGLPTDFADFELIWLSLPFKDCRSTGGRETDGDTKVEIPVIPPSELRRPVTNVVEGQIDADRWNSLLPFAGAERATVQIVLSALGTEAESRSHGAEGEGTA